VFGELGALPKICEEKLLVRCKTLIYCGQLCNNAVNYPSTPLSNAMAAGTMKKIYTLPQGSKTFLLQQLHNYTTTIAMFYIVNIWLTTEGLMSILAYQGL
jgi:hypothetical protein